MSIKSRIDFFKEFKIGDIVSIEFAHKKENGEYKDWVMKHYEFKDITDSKIYLVNATDINDMFVLSVESFDNESIRIKY